MTKKDIIDAYCQIRQTNHTIPDDVLDFMKEAALEKLEEPEEDIKTFEEWTAYLSSIAHDHYFSHDMIEEEGDYIKLEDVHEAAHKYHELMKKLEKEEKQG